ncbi:MAG TPA: HDOD domain-containing protein [Polyangiaceae bacterium]|jgi:HD-like signal output (HDOD) protein|nr:HDOD domain-containing protein [Polyangiaceae bacterium]
MPATTNVEAKPSNGKQIDRTALEARLVRELDGGRAALPILPHVAAQAIRFANDPNSDLRKLAEMVEADPPIAARLLAVANSVIYTRAVRVSSTRLAIIRLGLEGTRDLLFQVVYASSTVGLPRYQDLVIRSFRRSVLCGVAARLVSDKMRYRFEYDYLCGLLHDIGEARIYRILANYKEAIDPALLEDLVTRYHRRAGAELAIAWGLPEPIIETCAHHHDDPEKASRLVKMVMMADVLVAMLERRQAVASMAAAVATLAPSAAEGPTSADGATPASPPATLPSSTEAEMATALDGAPGPTDAGAALGPTSAIWPTSLTDPSGAPEPTSATWPKENDAPANRAPSSSSALPVVAAPVVATAPAAANTETSAEPTPEDRDAADFARLATLGMDRELADTILVKLDEAIADLPV